MLPLPQRLDALAAFPSTPTPQPPRRAARAPHQRRAARRCGASAAAPRACAAAAAASEAAKASPSPACVGPPAEYDHRAATAAAGAALAAAHPSLAALVAEGLLLSLPRSSIYDERRADGYEAPRHVYLLGTAHLSRRSAADVQAAVAALRPDAIVVELCRSRAGLMYADEAATGAAGAASPSADVAQGNALALGGESFGAALIRSVKLGGGGALLLRAALGAAARVAAAPPGAAPRPALGAEFAAARRAAADVGATLVLGDRPVEITLRRALAAATPAERLRAARLLLPLLLPAWLRRPAEQLTPEALDALLPDADAVGALFARFAADFPSLAPPLVHERDAYLAWSLSRSKAVCGKSAVLGVIGAGHLRGVAWALQRDGAAPGGGGATLRFDALVGRDADAAAAAAAPPLWQRLATDALLWGGAAAVWAALAQGDAPGQ